MPYMTAWIYEPYILRTTFTGLITIDDIDSVMRDYLTRLSGDQHLYFMVDFGRVLSTPTKMTQIETVTEVITHANTQWFAVVNPVGFDNNTTRLLVQNKVKVFNAREKAVGFLRGMVRLDTGLALE